MNGLQKKENHGKKILLMGSLTGLLLIGEIMISPILLFVFSMAYGDDPTTAAYPYAMNTWPAWGLIAFLLGYPFIYLLSLISSTCFWLTKKHQRAFGAIKFPVFYLLAFITYVVAWLLLNVIGII